MSKYDRLIRPRDQDEGTSIVVDVYSVLEAFGVTCPARAHAVKKLLCAGMRGKGDALQDLREAILAVQRAVDLEAFRVQESHLAEVSRTTSGPWNAPMPGKGTNHV